MRSPSSQSGRRQSDFCHFGQHFRTFNWVRKSARKFFLFKKKRSFVDADSHTSDILMARQHSQSPAHRKRQVESDSFFFCSFGVSLMIIDWQGRKKRGRSRDWVSSLNSLVQSVLRNGGEHTVLSSEGKGGESLWVLLSSDPEAFPNSLRFPFDRNTFPSGGLALIRL